MILLDSFLVVHSVVGNRINSISRSNNSSKSLRITSTR